MKLSLKKFLEGQKEADFIKSLNLKTLYKQVKKQDPNMAIPPEELKQQSEEGPIFDRETIETLERIPINGAAKKAIDKRKSQNESIKLKDLIN